MRDGYGVELARLLYFSRARAETIQNMTHVFPEILSVSQLNNSKRDITGCLLACNGWFIQVLEGPGDDVQMTYDSIRRDVRHTDLRLVEFCAANERRFPHWSMCGRQLSATDEEIVAVLEGGGLFDPSRLPADRAVQLLQRIQDMQVKHGEDRVFLD